VKAKGTTSIVIVVSFEKSSECACRIALERTNGSTGELTTLASITRAGLNYIPNRVWKEMFGISGLKETVDKLENGND
jgi:hypothetical protein